MCIIYIYIYIHMYVYSKKHVGCRSYVATLSCVHSCWDFCLSDRASVGASRNGVQSERCPFMAYLRDNRRDP